MAEGVSANHGKIAILSIPFRFLLQWSHKRSHDLKLGFVQDKLIGAGEGSGTSALTLRISQKLRDFRFVPKTFRRLLKYDCTKGAQVRGAS
jgi:hypothetical protein